MNFLSINPIFQNVNYLKNSPLGPTLNLLTCCFKIPPFFHPTPSASNDHISEMPCEIRLMILNYLEPEDLICIRGVSKLWKETIQNKYFQNDLKNIPLNPFQWIILTQDYSWDKKNSLALGFMRSPRNFFTRRKKGNDIRTIAVRYLSRNAQGIVRQDTITFTAIPSEPLRTAFTIHDSGKLQSSKELMNTDYFFAPIYIFPIVGMKWTYGDFQDEGSRYFKRLISGMPCEQASILNEIPSPKTIVMDNGEVKPRIERLRITRKAQIGKTCKDVVGNLHQPAS